MRRQKAEFRKMGLHSLPSCLAKAGTSFEAVRLLDLSENEIADLPVAFFALLPLLESLSLQYNRLSILHCDISRLSNLTVLRLDQNSLTCLPTSIGDMKKLNFLSVSRNKLATLPSSLCGLNECLRTLNVSENGIQMLPLDLGSLTALQELYIYHNNLVSIPTSLWRLTHLDGFSLEWFRYASPPLPTHFKGALFQSLRDQVWELLRQLYQCGMRECAFAAFVSSFSEGEFDVDRIVAETFGPVKILHKYVGRSLVQVAMLENDMGVLDALLPLGPKVDGIDPEGYSVLGLALREGNMAAAKKILLMKPNVRIGHGKAGGSLVHMAMRLYDADVTIELIRRGAKVNSFDASGETPLHILFAVFDKFPVKAGVIADAVLSAGGDPNIKNAEEFGAIHVAAEKEQLEGIRWIVEQNRTHAGDPRRHFDLDLQSGAEKTTALHIASGKCNPQIVQSLIGGRASACVRDGDDMVPRAMCRGVAAISKMLRRAEAVEIRERTSRMEESGDMCETHRGPITQRRRTRTTSTIVTAGSVVAPVEPFGEVQPPRFTEQSGRSELKSRKMTGTELWLRELADQDTPMWERYAALNRVLKISRGLYCAVRPIVEQLNTLHGNALKADVVYTAGVSKGSAALQEVWWGKVWNRGLPRAVKAEVYYNMDPGTTSTTRHPETPATEGAKSRSRRPRNYSVSGSAKRGPGSENKPTFNSYSKGLKHIYSRLEFLRVVCGRLR